MYVLCIHVQVRIIILLPAILNIRYLTEVFCLFLLKSIFCSQFWKNVCQSFCTERLKTTQNSETTQSNDGFLQCDSVGVRVDPLLRTLLLTFTVLEIMQLCVKCSCLLCHLNENNYLKNGLSKFVTNMRSTFTSAISFFSKSILVRNRYLP